MGVCKSKIQDLIHKSKTSPLNSHISEEMEVFKKMWLDGLNN